MEISSSNMAYIWFGAALSIAEIMTGTYFAGLDYSLAIAAIVLGHLIGGIFLFAAGLIGAKEKKSAMQTVMRSFGKYGSYIFIILNIIQLIGWTSIMIYDGSLAANEIWGLAASTWAIIIGIGVILWLFIGLSNFGKINSITGLILLALTIYLAYELLTTHTPVIMADSENSLTFIGALELAIAMPLSWLPLISDYTRSSTRPVLGTAIGTIVYTVTSIFMYLIGFWGATYTGESSLTGILVAAGLGGAGLFIILLSTITTTFLDAYSAGISSESLQHSLSSRTVAILVTIIGTIGAILYPMDDITNFLYLIGSVFAPMAALIVTDYFIVRTRFEGAYSLSSIIIWAIGVGLYHYFLSIDVSTGATISSIVCTGLLRIIYIGIKHSLVKTA